MNEPGRTSDHIDTGGSLPSRGGPRTRTGLPDFEAALRADDARGGQHGEITPAGSTIRLARGLRGPQVTTLAKHT
jgi:hypothetical protein